MSPSASSTCGPHKGLDSTDLAARRQEIKIADVVARKGQAVSDQSWPAESDALNNNGISAGQPAASSSTTRIGLEARSESQSLQHPSQGAEDDPQGPFEGPEKLLELWFADSPDLLPDTARTDDFSIMVCPEGKPLPGAKKRHRSGLRSIRRQYWEEMLELVHCKVLSVVEGVEVDAYLLSESSMFVFPHKLILKTCGTTTLLHGLQRILELAKVALSGSDKVPQLTLDHSEPHEAFPTKNAVQVKGQRELGSLVAQCFYSRKSFMFPDRQKGPHRDWMLEVQLLDSFFDGGSAYTVGKMNGDHWLLYMCCPGDVGCSPTLEKPLKLPEPGHIDAAQDQTLEMLMTDLSVASCKLFEFSPDSQPLHSGPDTYSLERGHFLGRDLSTKLGLTDMLPNTQLDAYAFEPCGYSANAIVSPSHRNSGGYWTIHVTPEQDSSYASFETNVRLSSSHDRRDGVPDARNKCIDVKGVIAHIVQIFEPGHLTLTLFTSRHRKSNMLGSKQTSLMEAAESADDVEVLNGLQLPGYLRKDRIAYQFDSYDLIFVHFEVQQGRD